MNQKIVSVEKKLKGINVLNEINNEKYKELIKS